MRAQLLPGDGPLARARPIVAFVVVIGLFLTGVLVSGVIGALLLGLLAVGVGILLATTWRVLAPTERVVRLVVLAVLAAVAILQLR